MSQPNANFQDRLHKTRTVKCSECGKYGKEICDECFEKSAEYVRQLMLNGVEKCRDKEMNKKLNELLDFAEWKEHEVTGVRCLTNLQLLEQEDLLTNGFGEMSQIDHVNMVITYKLKNRELYQALSDCFENAIGALGAGETIKPDADSEDFATRIFRVLEAHK